MKDRQMYIDKLSAQLKEWDAEISKLEAKADKVKADARIEYEKQITDLQNKKLEVKNRIGEIREAGEDAWEELKEGAEKSIQTMKNALNNALSRFK
ncbi:MAG: coiled coil domain-containing protein [Calditrichaeota bacterium]|nr:coiled coil domain-containing protein [Calditrichota bacterium]